MGDELQRALDFETRLENVARGDATQPEAHDLESLAQRVREALSPPPPNATFVASARRRFLQRLPRGPERQWRQPTPASSLVRRLAFAVTSALVAVALGTAGIAYAAQEAIPGDSLYGFKRSLEAARYSLTVDSEAKAALLSSLAAERIRELQGLADAGRLGGIQALLDDYEQTTDQLQSVVEQLPDGERAALAVARAAERMQHDQQVLEGLLEQVPAQAAPAIERAIERSSHGQEVLEALQQGLSPSDLAPGHSKTKEPGSKRTPGPRETKVKP